MRRSTILLATLVFLLVGAMAAAQLLVQPPPLRSRNAPDQFDARRAKERLVFILGKERPHPADSVADDEVRSRIVLSLRQMDIVPVVRDQFACNELYKDRGVSCARVRNVIATLGPPGSNALLINAHYDSVPAGPGASDDGIGVATLLGVADVLRHKALRRPVILLFNEGEELGLVGARAFLADPLSRNVGSLVNLDARGVRGPVNMFETSRPNAAAISWFAGAAGRPSANSLATDVYRLMPNYTDVNSFSERRWLMLNLAPVGNETRYHSPGDTVEALDPATLQHMGDQVLALAKAPPTGSVVAGNRIFMDVAGSALISLPLAAGVVLLILLLAGFATIAFASGGFVRSTVVVVGTIAGSTALAWASLAMLGMFRDGMFWRAYPIWVHSEAYAGVLLVGAALLASFGRPLATSQLRRTFWLLFLVIGALIGLAAPGGIVFFLVPPLLVGIGYVLGQRWKHAESIGAAAAILFLYLTWGEMLGVLEELLNDGPMWVFAPLGSLLLVPALIEGKRWIDAQSLRTAAGLPAALFLASSAAAAVAPAYSSDREQRFVIQHVTDGLRGKAWWSILNGGARLPASLGSGWARRKLPFSDAWRWVHSAPLDRRSKAPQLRIASIVRTGEQRTIVMRLFANGNNDIELIGPDDSKIRSSGSGTFVRRIDADSKGKYYIDCSGRSCDGATLELTTEHPGRLRLLLVGTRSVLPPFAGALLASRPKLARPQYSPDESLAFTPVDL
jgi:Peptidase family M28